AAVRSCGCCGCCATRSSSPRPAKTPRLWWKATRSLSATRCSPSRWPRSSATPERSTWRRRDRDHGCPVTRIVAGAAKGRRLIVPARGTRPTSDRAREALFSTLGGLLDLAGTRVLDLYAGTGAVGLEALSRGAAQALLVGADPRAPRAVREHGRHPRVARRGAGAGRVHRQ